MKFIPLFISLLFSAEVEHDFIITEGIVNTYGFVNKGLLINGQFPGPEIHLEDGDWVILNLQNESPKPLTIHFHGIRQRFSGFSDGVPMVTQYPIQPQQSYQYRFQVDGQPGTFYYHAHTELNANWIHGPLIVHESEELKQSLVEYNKQYRYDEERIITISDSWHNTTDVLLDGILVETPFKWVNNSQSILVNGQTYQEMTPQIEEAQLKTLSTIANFDELMSQSYFELPNQYSVIDVEPNKVYRLRLIGATDLSFTKFSIANHKLTIIEIDGVFVDPIEVDYVQLNNGQRYSVLLRTNQPPSNYWLFNDVLDTFNRPTAQNGLAILSYGTPVGMELALPATQVRALFPQPILQPGENQLFNQWVVNQLNPSRWYQSEDSFRFKHPYYRLPLSLDKEIILRGIEEKLPNGAIIWQFNNSTYQDPEVPFYDQLKSQVEENNPQLLEKSFEFQYNNVFEFTEGEVVQIVIQNTVGSIGTCDEHPWHLHGHTYHIVGSGPGEYNPSVAAPIIEQNIQQETTIFRDVATIYPYPIQGVAPINATLGTYPEGTPCGWMALRFRADNPGAWIMHCHITAHMLMGKRLVLIEKPLGQEF